MPMTNVEVQWEVAADPQFVERSRSEVRRSLDRSSATASTSRSTGLEPWRETTGIASASATRSVRPDARGRRRRSARPSTGSGSACAAAATTRPATSPATGASQKSNSTSCSTPATTSTRDAPMAAATPTRVRQHHGHEIYSVVDYRNRYALVQVRSRSDGRARVGAVHRRRTTITKWTTTTPATWTSRDTPSELFLLRRAPRTRRTTRRCRCAAAPLPTGSSMRLYRRLQFGCADRLQRARHAPVPIEAGVRRRVEDRLRRSARLPIARSSAPSPGEVAVREPRRSARARWTVLGQQVPTFARDLRTVQSRRTLLDGQVGRLRRPRAAGSYARLKETRAPNPIVLSGDVHLHYGSDLKLDFTRPDSETVGAEFTNTSMTSGGDGATSSAAWERTKPDNPHIKYHSARRGYIACTATPGHDARGFQDPRPGHGARTCLPGSADRSSSRQDGPASKRSSLRGRSVWPIDHWSGHEASLVAILFRGHSCKNKI